MLITITFLPINIKIQAEAGSNLFQTARENGIGISGVCSGNKTCGKCKVLITKGKQKEFKKEESEFLTKKELEQGIRLACCFLVCEDTCVILPEEETEHRYGFKDDFTTDSHPMLKGKSEDSDSINEEDLNKDRSNKFIYGISFDIGTTSVAAELWNLATGKSLSQISTLNPQSSYGADVISRITYAISNTKNREKLTMLIRQCCKINLTDICKATAAGNTTMTHLFLDRPVDTLSKVPFIGISYEGEERKPSDMGFDMNEKGVIYVLPGIGGHVGSDTLGCIISSGIYDTRETILIVDIGTNGEIVLARGGKLTVCSTAAGPAFEGAALYQGMRAVKGAITQVKINSNGSISTEYIGSDIPGIKPEGICGSGIIEAASELLKNDMMDITGRLLGEAGDKNYISLWKEGNKEVRVTQKDIRELQLAKGAVYAGMKILLNYEGINFDDLDKIYLAGAFGTNLNVEKAIHIGLIPDIDPDKYRYIGNGALAGAAMLLLNKITWEAAEQIAKTASHLELALREDFEEEFMNAVSFPER
jgi:uncharacterized 2Fe-2S/4Fe-4S cluster protein (DUF4445 family)